MPEVSAFRLFAIVDLAGRKSGSNLVTAQMSAGGSILNSARYRASVSRYCWLNCRVCSGTRYQLRSMIKLVINYLSAKLSIGFCEQLMFVPYLNDDLRRSDIFDTYNAKVYVFFVFSDGS